jgi:hypothetical protein
MPNHKGVARSLILGIGGTANLLFGITFLTYPGLEFPQTLSLITAIFFSGMICYLLGVWVAFISPPPFFLLPLCLGLLTVDFFELSKPIEQMVFESSLGLIIFGGLTCGIALILLGRDSLSRQYCGKTIMGFGTILSVTGIQRYSKKKTAQSSLQKWPIAFERLEKLILEKMNRHRSQDMNRYVPGNLFLVFRKLFGGEWALSSLLLIVIMFLSCGYLIEDILINFPIIFPIIIASGLDLIPHGNLFLPIGRTEKFYSSIVSGLMVTLLFSLIMVIIATISFLLSAVLPEIEMRGSVFAYQTLDVRGSSLCLFLIPIMLAIGPLIRKSQLALFNKTLFALGSFLCVGAIFIARNSLFSFLGILGFALLVLISWIGFALIMRYHCYRSDLVGQNR